MTRVFTLNNNGKIEITEEELRKLLNYSYWAGYYDCCDCYDNYDISCLSDNLY